MLTQNICLLNDSFPPLIDGVANAVTNYARVITESGGKACVVTPDCPGANDDVFPYPVIRYPSLDLTDKIGYTVGNPFNIGTLLKLQASGIGLLHSHCPAVSNAIARTLRTSIDAPFIMTYHTKFDVDIANAIRWKMIQSSAIKALIDSVASCDELWVVSEGAGQNLRDLGYTGEYIVMHNGVDMPRGRVSEDVIHAATAQYDLPQGVPVFLFVGRLMWYKGIRLILDALAALKSRHIDFRMVFIGGGGDEVDVRQYVENLHLGDKVLFTGKISDRKTLAAWYCRSDLLLFPSTYDTNGLVVREAAACSLGTVVINGSCAAEGIEDETNGLLIEENAASLAVCLSQYIGDRDASRRVGENACRDLYLSWDDAVKTAMQRYEVVMDKHRCGEYKKRKKFTDDLFFVSGELLSFFATVDERKKARRE